MTGSNERNSSDIYLVDFFIYCPLLCEKEGQEGRKILYYYPSDVDIDRQILEIGYCEGLVKFTETFDFDAPCETVHFQKTRLIFYQIDHDICFAMTIHVPGIERKKDDKEYVEYFDEKVNDRLMLPILKMSYQYFVLQYGSLFALLHYEGVEKLKTILRKHFDKFIEYHLNTIIDNVNIDSSYFGLEFLPISTKDYLKTLSILRRLESRCSALRETFLLYRNQIIWSGLNQYDTTLLYSFFRLYYWPHIQLLENTSTIQYITIDSNTIPDEELIASVDIISQEFYLGELFLPYRILVVHLNFFTLFCIFNHDEYLPDHEIIPSITEILEKDFNTMLPEFEECTRTKYPTTDTLIKSVYFNKSNMAHATTIDWKQEPHSNIAGVMNTISEDLQWFPSSGELLVKRENDPWIIAKRSDMRELIVTVNQKNANLKEISDKIKQIFSTEFNNIFLLE